MNEHIDWTIDSIRSIAKIYRITSAHCAGDPDLSAFLGVLAGQEDEVCRFILEIAETGNCLPIEDLVKFHVMEELTAIRRAVQKAIEDGCLDRSGILECVVGLETIKWNALLISVVDCAPGWSRELQQMTASIEKQRTTAEAFLEREPESGELLHIIQNLAPVWKKRILILDDEPFLGRLLAAMLDSSWECEAYERAREALARLRAHHFDIVISDYTMPGMNGVDFFHEAVTVDPTLASRFLFISASHDDHFIEFVETGGMNRLTKPVTMQELHGAIAQILHAH